MVEKIGIEMVEKKAVAVAEEVGKVMGLWMRKEVENIRRENKLINESIEEIRRIISDGKSRHTGIATSSSSPTLAAVRRTYSRVALLAFHQALVQKPQDPLVVASFTLAIHNGGDILETLDIAKGISHPHEDSFPELLELQEQNANGELCVKFND